MLFAQGNGESINNPGNIQVNENIDNLKPGFYIVSGFIIGSGTTYGTLLSLKRSEGDQQQMVFSNGGAQIGVFYRMKNNGTWSAWMKLSDNKA
ncbi:pyocin knob domain-containing protein [uncultured Clostridium sp.]|uniref:pyocin knob domain-containing protein n=1 Tax=uncultured Clostridium sp. TaxID=59620 RepID=UPI0025F225EC|nr:pyocin knob domain-containing protein [uncultured Clostridium sp.]